MSGKGFAGKKAAAPASKEGDKGASVDWSKWKTRAARYLPVAVILAVGLQFTRPKPDIKSLLRPL